MKILTKTGKDKWQDSDGVTHVGILNALDHVCNKYNRVVRVEDEAVYTTEDFISYRDPGDENCGESVTDLDNMNKLVGERGLPVALKGDE